MNVSELRHRLEKHAAALAMKKGKQCYYTDSGPIGVQELRWVVSALAAQEARLEELERKLSARQ